MGDTDDPNNIIELSVEEHAKAHFELYQKHGKQEDYLAWKSLTKQIGHQQIFAETSRIGGLKNKGKSKTKDHKSKISDSNTGNKSHWKKGDVQKKKFRFYEVIKKILEFLLGNLYPCLVRIKTYLKAFKNKCKIPRKYQ